MKPESLGCVRLSSIERRVGSVFLVRPRGIWPERRLSGSLISIVVSVIFCLIRTCIPHANTNVFVEVVNFLLNKTFKYRLAGKLMLSFRSVMDDAYSRPSQKRKGHIANVKLAALS